MKKIVLFDGDCHFCHRSVQFIIKRDPTYQFQFASLQSKLAQELLLAHHLSPDVESLVLIDGNRAYKKSTAALQIGRNLTGMKCFSNLGLLVPKIVRDNVYDLIATYRHTLFTNKNACSLLSKKDQKRFLISK